MTPALFSSLLIANRGEIVARVARSARARGLHTVAVYSDADRHAPFVHSCDSAVGIGGERPADSYLRMEHLVQTAVRVGAQAVHPGYGFLSENPRFAQAVQDAGLVWVGPPPSAMQAMGDKAQARRHMQDAGVPVLPGTREASTDLAALRAQAHSLGLPLMVKAAAGGGGRGMRLVQQASELDDALGRALSEASAAFGDGRLLLERALLAPRHVEVQILADAHGHVIHLGERDCTVQRRHQKLIEEAPSPAVDPVLRRRLGEAAVCVARAVGYVGAGTVEFLLDTAPGQEGAFYFMEMNTRLQVEHPVTEALTGLDLVDWQLRIAQGEHLDLQQDAVLQRFESSGHAIEVRLCAEDPVLDHMPQSGPLLLWQPPADLRCDAALASGQHISPYYDSMLGKLIAQGSHRTQAIQHLAQGLDQTVCLGLPTNIDFLAQVLRDPVFVQGRFSTSVLRTDIAPAQAPDSDSAAMALAAVCLACLPRSAEEAIAPGWWNWRSTHAQQLQVPLRHRGARWVWQLRHDGVNWYARLNETTYCVSGLRRDTTDRLHALVQDIHLHAHTAWDGDTLWLQVQGQTLAVHDERLHASTQHLQERSGNVAAPMHGRVVRLDVQAGQQVQAGDVLLVMEAMKMEHRLSAPRAGTVQHVRVQAGEQVAARQCLVELAPLPQTVT